MYFHHYIEIIELGRGSDPLHFLRQVFVLLHNVLRSASRFQMRHAVISRMRLRMLLASFKAAFDVLNRRLHRLHFESPETLNVRVPIG